MAEDVTLRWGSTGFEKLNQEFVFFQMRSDDIRSWGEKIAGGFKRMEEATQNWFRQHKESIGQGITILGDLGNTAVKVSAAFLGLGTVIAGTAAAVVGEFGKAVIKATESNRQLEMSLYGATNSWEAVAKVEKFADQYAREYAVGSEQTLKAMRELAFIPALRPIIAKGDVEEMKNYMDLARALVLIRPEAGIQGAETALRQAFMGRWRGLQQYGIRPEDVAALQGVSVKTLEHKPEVALAGLEKWKEHAVGADALAQSLKTVGAQVTMLHSIWHEWLETIGKTGIYSTVVGYLTKMREAFAGFMESDKMRKWTTEINAMLEGVVNTIATVFTKGVNWDISSFSGLLEAIKQVSKNIIDELGNVWLKVKDPLTEGLAKAIGFAADALIVVVAKAFVPVGKSIATAIYDGVMKGMEERPIESLITLAIVGATMTPGGALPKVVGGATLPAAAMAAYLFRKQPEQGAAPPSPLEFLPGHEAMTRRQLAEEQGPPPLPAWMTQGQGAIPVAEKEYSQYKLWEHMAATMAKAPVGPQEPTGASYLFATGKIKEPEYFQRKKMEEFGEERMTRLGKIAEMPEAEPATKSKIFEEMFGVAAGRGDFSKAQEYMNKSIDAMVQAGKEQVALVKEQNANVKATAENTGEANKLIKETIDLLQAIKENSGNSGNEETRTVTAQEKQAQIPDELLKAVTDPWTEGW